VQGVFFRDTVRGMADARGVAGWVQNNPDGTVEAVFEGSPQAVFSMVELTRGGPGRAEVDGIDEIEEAPEGLTGFTVR
jgi:acylphosphatase